MKCPYRESEPHDTLWAAPMANLPCERVGTHLNLVGLGPRRGASFVVEHRARARCRPQSAAFPARARIVDASIHVLAEEAHGIRDMDVHELAVDQRQKRLAAIGLRDRHVGPKPQRVVSIDPDVIGVIGATRVGDALELWPWKRIERPPFRAMFSGGRSRSV